jgi:hypothetical protein
MTTSDHNSPVSQIITALKAHVSPIGTPAGVAGLTASTTSALASGESLQALLPPSVRSACRERTTSYALGEYGFEPIVVGLELVGPVDEAERNEARIIVAAALQPSAPTTIKRELVRLRFATANRELDQDGMNLMMAIYAETLIEYPEDVVVKTCRDWVKRGGKFWPALAELTEPADRLVKERRDLADALARGPKPPPEPDPEDIERRRLVAEQERRWAEAAEWRRAHPELTTAQAPPREWAGGDKPLPPLAPFHLPEVEDLPEAQRWLAEMEATPP